MSATKHDWPRFGDLEFEDGEETSSFIIDVSEQLWGDATCITCGDVLRCDCEDRREPYTLEESIARLKEFNEKALAWDALCMHFNAPPFEPPHMDDDTEEDYEMRELMEKIMKGVKQQ